MVDAYGTFLPMLQLAIEQTRAKRILELGMGENSTPYLHDLAVNGLARVVSYDNNPEWFSKYEHLFVDASHTGYCESRVPIGIIQPYDVALIDHAPGESRRSDILRLKSLVKVFVVHDTEESADRYGYFFSTIWHHFKHLKHDTVNGVRTTIASNAVDVSQWQLRK